MLSSRSSNASWWGMARRRLACVLGLAVIAGIGGLLTTGSTSCAPSPDSKRYTEILQPDYPTYRTYVDTYLQRRCGTLDCHGQPGRAYRIYGYGGLRPFDAGEEVNPPLASGQQVTLEQEVLANYQAAIALEPEEMSRVMAKQGADPNSLLLLRKPLKLERHKGGPAMSEEDPGYRCVVAWLRVRVIRPTSDGLDFETIPEGDRDQLSRNARDECEEAKNFP